MEQNEAHVQNRTGRVDSDDPWENHHLPVDSMHEIELMLWKNPPKVRHQTSSIKVEKGMITENGPCMTSYHGSGHPPGEDANGQDEKRGILKRTTTAALCKGEAIVRKLKTGILSSKH
ncbi:hypothetical protein BWQ96_09873 [Gracilariopsis chorda]|uniref:Uncharacterized protein n=1 Tax=Gracilariopsis chorda TaxID=448386 RepID=A0A2V3IEC1_9FLOR|nr:hypothetical protein BWQ96_09873 [Gracilariopsis chorda]|eukprot:PXF40413.1 hypothetical protein BWQ96_09873 [Gracilariopsis chorda]